MNKINANFAIIYAVVSSHCKTMHGNRNTITKLKYRTKMKKILFFVAAVAMTAMTMVSCDNSEPATLKDDVDTFVYNYGLVQSTGLKQYMAMQLNVDTAYMDEFIKGIKEGALKEHDPKKYAYIRGLQIGSDIKEMAKGLDQFIYEEDTTKHINVNILVNGVIDELKDKAKIAPYEANKKVQEKIDAIRKAKYEKQDSIHKAQLEKEFGPNKKAGEKYLAENKKKEGVKVTESGLQYKVLVEGDGALPTDTSTVKVNYEGRLIDGTVFDSSYQRNQPFPINMSYPEVIEGWVEVLKMMPAGSKWEVTIPYDLAYGAKNMGEIKPFSTLIFTIEVLK